MKIRSHTAAVLCRLALFLLSALTVLTVCGLLAHKFDFSPLRRLALFSNAVCAVYFFVSFLFGLFSSRECLPRFRGAVIILLCTSVILDAAGLAEERSSSLVYITVHALIPALAVMEWLLFAEKGKFRWISPVLWLILPNLYFAYVILRVKLIEGALWLYPFLNVHAVGIRQFLKELLTVNVYALALGYLIVSIDMLTVKPIKSARQSTEPALRKEPSCASITPFRPCGTQSVRS